MACNFGPERLDLGHELRRDGLRSGGVEVLAVALFGEGPADGRFVIGLEEEDAGCPAYPSRKRSDPPTDREFSLIPINARGSGR